MSEYQKDQSNNDLKNLKENNKLKRVKVYVVTNCFKDEEENLSDSTVYTDDDSVGDRVIGFR